MSNQSPPPLPYDQNEGGGNGEVMRMIALTCSGIAFLALGAAACLSFRETSPHAAAGPVLLVVSVLAALAALLLGFLSMVTAGDGKRAQAVTSVVCGVLVIMAAIALSLIGMFRSVNRQLKIATGALTERSETVAPFEIDPDSRTEADTGEVWHRWFQENMYQAHQSRLAGKPWEKTGGRILKAFEDDWIGKMDRFSDLQWQKLAADLVREKCDDPLLLYMASRSCDMSGWQFTILNKASDKLGRSDLNPLWALMAEIDKFSTVEYSASPEKRKATQEEILRRLGKACKAGCFKGEKLWMLDRILIKNNGPDFTKPNYGKIADVFEATAMPEWTVLWMRGKASIRKAWKHRSSRSAAKVSGPGWTGFRKELTNAREQLEKSWQLAPEFPFAAASMITVCMGNSDHPREEMRLWFDRAMTAQMDNWEALNAYKYGLEPRWHGSEKMVAEMGRACLNSNRFDSFLPFYYLRSIEWRAKRSPDKLAFYANQEVYQNLSYMLDGYLEANPAPSTKRVYRTYQAVFSYRAGDYEELGRVWSLLKGNPDRRVLGKYQINEEDFAFRALVKQGDLRLHYAERLRKQGRFDQAIAEYQSVLADTDRDSKAHDVLLRRTALLNMEKLWNKGGWVTLLPTAGPDLWRTLEGIRLPGKGPEMRVRSDTFRYVIDHPLMIGKDFEIELGLGKAERAVKTPGHGIWVSTGCWYARHVDCLRVREASRKKSFVEVGRWRYRPKWEAEIKKSASDKIIFRCQNGQWSVFLNGKEMNKAEIKMNTHHIEDYSILAIAGYVNEKTNSGITYKSVRVRKLKPLPETKGKPAKK